VSWRDAEVTQRRSGGVEAAHAVGTGAGRAGGGADVGAGDAGAVGIGGEPWPHPIIPLVNARVMAALIPRARLHVYHDGHLALVTDAATLAPLIVDFLDEPAAPSGPQPVP
jgi:hypothetical protein